MLAFGKIEHVKIKSKMGDRENMNPNFIAHFRLVWIQTIGLWDIFRIAPPALAATSVKIGHNSPGQLVVGLVSQINEWEWKLYNFFKKKKFAFKLIWCYVALIHHVEIKKVFQVHFLPHDFLMHYVTFMKL